MSSPEELQGLPWQVVGYFKGETLVVLAECMTQDEAMRTANTIRDLVDDFHEIAVRLAPK